MTEGLPKLTVSSSSESQSGAVLAPARGSLLRLVHSVVTGAKDHLMQQYQAAVGVRVMGAIAERVRATLLIGRGTSSTASAAEDEDLAFLKNLSFQQLFQLDLGGKDAASVAQEGQTEPEEASQRGGFYGDEVASDSDSECSLRDRQELEQEVEYIEEEDSADDSSVDEAAQEVNVDELVSTHAAGALDSDIALGSSLPVDLLDPVGTFIAHAAVDESVHGDPEQSELAVADVAVYAAHKEASLVSHLLDGMLLTSGAAKSSEDLMALKAEKRYALLYIFATFNLYVSFYSSRFSHVGFLSNGCWTATVSGGIAWHQLPPSPRRIPLPQQQW